MGRTKYTTEERKAIIADFIEAAAEIIDEEGIDRISIRKVSARAGFSSATLYIYFKDLDELCTLASIGYLEEYCRSLVESRRPGETPVQTYLRTWEQFCRTAFRRPKVFRHLFFDRHTAPLDEIAKRYYSVYPDQLDHISGPVLSMVLTGDLYARNLKVLMPCTAQLGFDDARARLVNDVTVSYFHTYLDRICDKDLGEKDRQSAADRFLSAARYLIGAAD